jgi:hypothetical protein
MQQWLIEPSVTRQTNAVHKVSSFPYFLTFTLYCNILLHCVYLALVYLNICDKEKKKKKRQPKLHVYV